MSTKQAVEQALHSLTMDEFIRVAEELRIGREMPANQWQQMSDQQWREHHMKKMLQAYDLNKNFKVLLLRALRLPTAQESQLGMQAASTDAAVRSAEAAEQSAQEAQRSANAAENSQKHARSSKTATWLNVVLTLIAVLISIAALFKSFGFLPEFG